MPILVAVGSNSRQDLNLSRLYRSERIIWHENWNETELVNDVALIRVGRDIKFSETVKSISLPKENLKFDSNFKAILSGWGSLNGVTKIK